MKTFSLEECRQIRTEYEGPPRLTTTALARKHRAHQSSITAAILRAGGRMYSRKIHGESNKARTTPEYIAWQKMRARCTNPKEPAFHNYGGRDIRVCDRWRESYVNFLSDVGRRPSPDHSLDRIDVNGNYEPGNVRWATRTAQGRNKRNNHLLTCEGETLTLTEWAKRTGLPRGAIRARLRLGWTEEKTLKEPLRIAKVPEAKARYVPPVSTSADNLKPTSHRQRLADLTGQRFGILLVLKLLGSWHYRRYWQCRCDCGNVATVATNYLLSGKVKSCGCKRGRIEDGPNGFTSPLRTHGGSASPEYNSWKSMRQRCRDGNDPAYPYYGGRGIKVCARWLHSFANFLADMGPKPSPQHSLDRIDVNRGYSPANCRWVTRKEQARNTRANRVIIFEGKALTLAAWSELTGIGATTIYVRLNHLGWTVEEALTKPVVAQSRR